MVRSTVVRKEGRKERKNGRRQRKEEGRKERKRANERTSLIGTKRSSLEWNWTIHFALGFILFLRYIYVTIAKGTSLYI